MPNYWYDHIHLVSPSPLETAQFYEKMFDARVVTNRQLPDGRTSIGLDLNGSRILLMERHSQVEAAPGSAETGYGLEHFGIRTDNIEAAVTELKAKGVKFRDEITTIASGTKIAYLWGPENVLVELLELSG